MTKGRVILAYKLQVISSVTTDVLRDVPVSHPFGDSREPSTLEGIGNSDKTKNVGMG